MFLPSKIFVNTDFELFNAEVTVFSSKMGVSLDKTFKSPSLVWVEPREKHEYVGWRCDMTEMMSKAA